MLDGWNYNNGLNPIVKDDNDDPDRDGLTNLLNLYFQLILSIQTLKDTLTEQILNGWNPLQNAIITDSDEDGLSDFEEIRLSTNSNSPDSDNDSISDSDEVAYGLDLTDDANDDSTMVSVILKRLITKLTLLKTIQTRMKYSMAGKLKISLILYWMIQKKILTLMAF